MTQELNIQDVKMLVAKLCMCGKEVTRRFSFPSRINYITIYEPVAARRIRLSNDVKESNDSQITSQTSETLDELKSSTDESRAQLVACAQARLQALQGACDALLGHFDASVARVAAADVAGTVQRSTDQWVRFATLVCSHNNTLIVCRYDCRFKDIFSVSHDREDGVSFFCT